MTLINHCDSVGLTKLMQLSGGRPEVTVAMIDGPVDTRHPGLAGIRGQVNGACGNADSLGCRHGTFVAGLLTALCPRCTVLSRPIFCASVDIGSCPTVTTADLAQALSEVIEGGADIVNLSVGLKDHAGFYAAPLRRLYDHAQQRGILIVGAAGNQGADSVNPLFEHDWIIPVGAAGPDGQPIETSNWAAGLLAPGLDVESLAPRGKLQRMSGTSVAAPFVTSALALLKSLFPEASAEALRQAVLESSSPGPARGPPLLDAFGAYRQLLRQYRNQPGQYATMDLQNTANEEATRTAAPDLGQTELTVAALPESLVPQSCGCGGSSPCACNGKALAPMAQASGFVYALGSIRPVFPDEGLRKEFEFAARTVGATDLEYYKVFSQLDERGLRKYLYIAEQVLWVMDIAESDTYIVTPRSNAELLDLIESLAPNQDSLEETYCMVIGPVGPASSPEVTGGLQLPIVVCNQIYYFTFSGLFSKIASEHSLQVDSIRQVIKAFQFKPNHGNSDELRALNYIAVRYPEIYAPKAKLAAARANAQEAGKPFNLMGIKTELEDGAGGRRRVNVIFNYQSAEFPCSPSFLYTQVDTTGQFPFVSAPLQEYIPKV